MLNHVYKPTLSQKCVAVHLSRLASVRVNERSLLDARLSSSVSVQGSVKRWLRPLSVAAYQQEVLEQFSMVGNP
jgi:hypothetical protein